MLYDPKWDKESMPAFMAWLETKDPHEGYHFMRPQVCACGQYAEHIGVGAANWMGKKIAGSKFWDDANTLAMGSPRFCIVPAGWTFGRLLERCRAYVEA